MEIVIMIVILQGNGGGQETRILGLRDWPTLMKSFVIGKSSCTVDNVHNLSHFQD
jgi:hypothetical protein